MQKDLETDKSSRKRRTRASASGLSTILQQKSTGVAISVWLRNMVSKRERWSGQWTCPKKNLPMNRIQVPVRESGPHPKCGKE